MRKILSLLLVLVMVFAFASCVEEKPSTLITVEAKEGFNNSGFYQFVAESAGTYVFEAESSDSVQWSVYVLDEEFPEGVRYISQAFEPSLEGEGELSIESGKYVYIYCSVNGLTADEPDENAKLIVSVK